MAEHTAEVALLAPKRSTGCRERMVTYGWFSAIAAKPANVYRTWELLGIVVCSTKIRYRGGNRNRFARYTVQYR